MAGTIKIRSQRQDDRVEIKILIAHPMENGRNRDDDGRLIPAHFIERLQVKLNQQAVLNIDTSGSVSKNPFFTLRLKSAASGDRITVEWTDNRQTSDSLEHRLD